jgi:hypothetical protein
MANERVAKLLASSAILIGVGGLLASISNVVGATTDTVPPSEPILNDGESLSSEDVAAMADQIEIAELSDSERQSVIDVASASELVQLVTKRAGVEDIEVIPQTDENGTLIGARVSYVLARPYAGGGQWLTASRGSGKPVITQLPIRKMTILDAAVFLPDMTLASVQPGFGTEYARPPVGTQLTLKNGEVVTLTRENFSYDQETGQISVQDDRIAELATGK